MHDQSEHNRTLNARVVLAFLVFAMIGAFFLFTEHRAHVIPFLPWLLLAACPLMHLFMHGGHGGRADHASHGAAAAPGTPQGASGTRPPDEHRRDGGPR